MTAIEAAARLAGRRGRVLLHSGEDGDDCGRYSFVSSEPAWTVEARGDSVVVRDRTGAVESEFRGDPLAAVDELSRACAATGHPAHPIAIGYLGYGYGRVLHSKLPPNSRISDEPDLWFGVYTSVWRRDERTGRAEVLGSHASSRDRLSAALSRPAQIGPPPRLGSLAATPGDDELYARGFERLREYIAAGDVYQVNLARRLSAAVLRRGDSLALYQHITNASAAAYGAVLDLGDTSIVSASPERFLALTGDRLETRPIKGTRRRTHRPAQDIALAAELRSDEKELAEHLMIVDLLRNDLGRVADIGSVRVDDFARVVELPTLYHLVSTVSCRVTPNISLSQLMGATFPGGSITGAPKLRAMQIIDELEPWPRGVYTGAIGYVGADGGLDFSIAIRTGVLRTDRLDVFVGGGVVADSTHTRELEETEEKASAWRRAVGALY